LKSGHIGFGNGLRRTSAAALGMRREPREFSAPRRSRLLALGLGGGCFDRRGEDDVGHALRDIVQRAAADRG
jgi:hypothetical protein